MEALTKVKTSERRSRTALLATNQVLDNADTDRHVIFLASQLIGGSKTNDDTRTWPHHRSLQTIVNDYTSTESSPQVENKLRNQTSILSNDAAVRKNISCSSSGHTRTNEYNRTRTNRRCSKRNIGIGVYGWRKRFLYILVLGLTVVVIINLAITLWLLKIMEFTFEGIGSLKIIPGGIELKGQAAILNTLIVSSIKSKRGSNLMLESWSNFSALARSDNGQVLARFTISEDKVECVSQSFHINNPNGGLLFSANEDRIIVGAETLKITGVSGAIFEDSIQTPHISSEASRDLRLESATRKLNIQAPQNISVESSAGGISAVCHSHLKLAAEQGNVMLESRNIFIKGLTEEHDSLLLISNGPKNFAANRRSEEIITYQLCVCANGKLFLALSDETCHANKSIC